MMTQQRNSLKGTHNKNIFSFDDRYYMSHLADHVNSHVNGTTTHGLPTITHHATSSPLQRHGSILSKSRHHYKHLSKHASTLSANSPPPQQQQQQGYTPNESITTPSSIVDLNIAVGKDNFTNSSRNSKQIIKIFVLHHFKSVSERVKFALLEIFKFKKVLLGDKFFDIPFDFICICDTLELPMPLVG